MSEAPYILYIPEIAIEKIFSYLSFDDIAKNRLVCRKFNEVGGRLLSRGFIQLDKRHSMIFKRVKSMLPRRESERRVHLLSRHCDILQAVETRISMLTMTYMKYIESGLLCFIPGKVLDEVITVLNLVETEVTPPRPHQLLQELRDLSSMAMEHFDEHILPRVKEQKEQMSERRQSLLSPFASTASPETFKQTRPCQSTLFVQQSKDIGKMKKQYKVHKHHIGVLNQNTLKLMQKIKKQNARIKVQSMKIHDQERKIQEQFVKIQEQETAVSDIKKHLDEWDQKYKDLTAELIRTRDNLLLRPTTSLVSSPSPPAPPKFFKTSIKPRMAQILRKTYHINLDMERKRKSNLLPDIPVKISRRPVDEETNINKLKVQLKKESADKSKSDVETKSNLSFLIDSFIKTPLSTINKSRKRKLPEEKNDLI